MGSLIRAEPLEEGRLLRLSLDAPKGNILSQAMMGEISSALSNHREDPRLRLVLLTAEGTHFSFGASVEEHRREQAPAMLAAFHALIRNVAGYPVPIAAVVQGQCLGGSFELVLACHLVFATVNASFACPEVKLGVFPPVLAAIGPLRLGHALAERLLLTGDSLDAESAHRLGFVARLLTGNSGQDEVLRWFQEVMAPLSAFAIRQATKVSRRSSGILQALDVSLAQAERQYLEEVLTSRDGNEGIAAFLERRKPLWQDF
jgi:cyclohexa-1,5-dienecarbonyl-CoA hydratase